jgi:HTH-type transcriptional regulator / antitoxin HigA
MSDTPLPIVFPPGEFIRDELEARGWTQADLAAILGRPLAAINEIINGKRAITRDTAFGLGEAFGTGPEYWLNLETLYQVATGAPERPGTVSHRAKWYDRAPISYMQKRGWLPETGFFGESLEPALCKFYRVGSVDEEPKLAVAARQSVSADALTPEQIAWAYRACQIAFSVPVRGEFSTSALRQVIPTLRQLARHPESAKQVGKALGEAGVRLVLVEHLPKSKIDGAALFIEGLGPIIAMSLRFDRIDYFWHTLLHEVDHLLHGDGGLDPDLSAGDEVPWSIEPEIEKRANAEAAAMLIPPDKLTSFIRRTAPLYFKERIVQFANLNNIHPGIVVGQLHHRGMDYKFNREFLAPINKYVIGTTITDGWGNLPSL